MDVDVDRDVDRDEVVDKADECLIVDAMGPGDKDAKLESERIAKNFESPGEKLRRNVASKPGLIPAALAVDLTYPR